ncbi:MAG: flagellar basal body P-ring formation protein FlgA [Azoarcus sp.]|jgi:flagella basal body P-ring formation protein FlgA|nr:flagellar basal body P-ring formation protein FlgA [Azoarcus sp.]
MSAQHPNARFCRALVALLIFICLTTAASVHAQQEPAPLEAIARQFIEEQTRGLPGEVSIELSPFDAHNQLPPCVELVAFLPAAARAWGAFSIGVRCDSPVEWTVYLQARVKLIADYFVTARPLRAGQIIGPDDLVIRRGDIAALADDILADASQAIGRHARHALAQGSPLQARMLRMPAAIQQGREVTVLSQGDGFQVSNTGRALNHAAPGETVRVRMPNNQIITGTAQANGTVIVGY